MLDLETLGQQALELPDGRRLEAEGLTMLRPGDEAWTWREEDFAGLGVALTGRLLTVIRREHTPSWADVDQVLDAMGVDRAQTWRVPTTAPNARVVQLPRQFGGLEP